MGIVWTILIGFVAGLVAREIKPGDAEALVVFVVAIPYHQL